MNVCTRCDRERTIRARGLCGTCYNYHARHPELPLPAKRNRTMQEWYDTMPRPEHGCWPWPGAKHTHGYGIGQVDGVRTLAHRWVYEQEVGPIPEGMTIDHVACTTKACVRPDHLEVVTLGENLRRAVPDRTPQVRRLGHGACTHGDTDLYIDPSGKRVCRICRRERTRLWRQDRATSGGLG